MEYPSLVSRAVLVWEGEWGGGSAGRQQVLLVLDKWGYKHFTKEIPILFTRIQGGNKHTLTT